MAGGRSAAGIIRSSRSPAGYAAVLASVKRRIVEARRRALSSVNRELVSLCWEIGSVIVRQQECAKWGDAVVERLGADLRASFPDMRGFSRDNLFRMRQFILACREIDDWFGAHPRAAKVGTPSRLSAVMRRSDPRVGTASRQFPSPRLTEIVFRLSWSHHCALLAGARTASERYFYLAMAATERWSVRELRRQIESDLFTRYASVRKDPQKCLPTRAESGDLVPFKDHYVLEFLGLAYQHSEAQLRRAILANLRDFFLEFGRDLCFVGEEYAVTVGNDTFSIDLLFFHRRLQCLAAVDLKIGKFKPEYVGKMQFYCAALDERHRLAHERPTIGLVLCKTADRVQVRLALTDAVRKIGVATYQTALPDERLIRARLARLPGPSEEAP